MRRWRRDNPDWGESADLKSVIRATSYNRYERVGEEAEKGEVRREARARKMRWRPSSRPSGEYHSAGEWAPPPRPPAPMAAAGQPSDNGTFASVEARVDAEIGVDALEALDDRVVLDGRGGRAAADLADLEA